MKTKKLLLIVAVIFCSTALFAQNNVVKLNIPSLGYTAFDVQYERAIIGPLSAQVSINYRPNGPIPMAKKMGLTTGMMSTLRLNWMQITPELRLYTSVKGAPRGFYFILPYFRYSKVSLKDDFSLNVPVPDATTGVISDDPTLVTMKGSLSLLGVGTGFGSHWMIKKLVSIDVTWLGFEYYFSNKFTASVESKDPNWSTLMTYAGDAVVDELGKIKGVTTKVTNTKIEASSKVPGLPFVRFGFTLGMAF